MARQPIYGRIKSTTSRPTRFATIRDLEWAAGFLEGEGTFFRHKHKTKHENGNGRYGGVGSERVAARQKHRECLDRLTEVFGGNVTLIRPKGRMASGLPCNPIWDWHVTGVLARGVMMTLFSLLSAWRKAQIRRALWKAASHGL